MQPPHMSYPSSSRSALASSHVQRYVHSALGAAGFSKSSGHAVELLTEVFERYLLLLGSNTKQAASHVGRVQPCAWDAEAALSTLGTSSEQLQSWLLDDGLDLAGQWALPQEDDDLDDGANLLGRRLRSGNATIPRPLELFYEDVSPEQLHTLEELLIKDEDEKSELGDEYAIRSSSRDAASTSEARTPPPPYPGSPSRTGYRKRSRSPDTPFPPFLPAFPCFGRTTNAGVVEDAEYARDKISRSQLGELKTEIATEAHEVSTKPIASLAADLPELPQRSADDLWRRAVPFLDSNLAAVHSADDLPALQESVSTPGGDSIERITSSMRAFANDYPALVREAKGNEFALLTPSGSQHARAFHQRRALAAFLADPGKYVPCDTLFGGVSARPTALPFQPTASMLITPPTAENSAPTFTPLRPNGRDLPSTTAQSHALYPSCRHRTPGNVLNAARLVSGGVATETYRRMTRIHDPDPILDDQHVERVFHGQQAPKELLVEGNSVLKGALDTLKVKRAEERAAARAELGLGEFEAMESGELDENGKPAGQLSMSATRDRIKVKNGTIVSTWDWMTRDFTDPVLPGKKFKTGTQGVRLGGGAAGDTTAGDESFSRPHQRSASIVNDLTARQRERSASRTR